MADHREDADRAEKSEQNEPIENADRNEPTDPIDNAEPIEPIDSTDPFDPIDSTEFSDHSDHRDSDILPGPMDQPPASSSTAAYGRAWNESTDTTRPRALAARLLNGNDHEQRCVPGVFRAPRRFRDAPTSIPGQARY
jgi:hypothetical protein